MSFTPMLEDVISGLINENLSKHLENFDSEQLSLSLGRGDV